MRHRRIWQVSAMVLMASATSLTAQTPPPASPVTTAPNLPGTTAADDPDVVVSASTDAAVERFIKATTPSPHSHQVARWNTRICPRALGFDAGHAAFMEARVGTVAKSLGLSVASGHCAANVVILATNDAEGFTRRLVHRYPALFGDPREGLATRTQVDRLLAPRAVRWITTTRTGNGEGAPGQATVGFNKVWFPTRLTTPTRENAIRSFIIVDGARMQHINWNQLADYCTMIALAGPTMQADYGRDTVLSIFTLRDQGQHGPAGLTKQDHALLTALYSTDPRLTADAQRSAIGALLRIETKAAP